MNSSKSYWWRSLAAVTLSVTLGMWFPLLAQEVDPDEAKEKAIVDRFVTVLEKNPRRGTALDRIYGFHVERGSLDKLISAYRDKAAKARDAEAAGAWMIVGLMESLRGQDAASVKAFESAEAGDKNNYLASYYLGQALVLVGQPDKAAEAFERAIQRKPAPTDQLDVYQALGRVYQRAQKNDKALEVWNRLEKQFPNDARVQEQIATTLLEEGEFAAALPRYENLIKLTKDKYRQSLFQMEAAEIKVRLGKGDDAIKEFEKLLSQLNPDNWLYREVRRRIEAVYLRTDDQAGLATYYEAWMKKNPEDLEAISRLAKLYAGLGRAPEAQQWLEKGLKAAPSKKELRLALINQLVYEQKYADAIAQYVAMDKNEPNNPDTLREWGRLILKDTARDEATRKKDAATVWRRLVTAKPKDALVVSQVAELFRQVEMTEEALELYKKSVELAPDQAQYREYLGEYFHSLKRKDEALTTWRQIAEGKQRTAPNLARLAEVMSGFGYVAEAVEANAEACKLDPKEINLQIKQVDLLASAEKHDDALKQLDVVKKLAATDEEKEAWLQRDLRELQATDRLKAKIEEVRKELEGADSAKAGGDEKGKLALAERWFWLARAYEAERQMKEAALAVTKASELAPQAVPILMSASRIQEAQNNLLGAIEINTKLASIDRRYRSEYLKHIATLESRLGRREKALEAGRDLIASAPGNPEVYEFFSQLCFGLGENEEGLGALRRSVRVNPTEPKGLLLLANALGEQFRTSESIELYWRAFDKAGNLEDRLSVVPKLTELYLQTNQFDRLLERLERQRREPNQQREMTICLAQAYQSAGDDGNARIELEKLLTDDTRDTQLLQQLVKLCENEGDLDAAIRFQQQFNKVSPGKDGTMRLAGLLMKAGETEEASVIMARITAEEKDPEQILKQIDGLLATNNFEQALRITERVTRDQPKNWEVLYREGVALAKGKPEEAAKRFQAILALDEKDDELSLATKSAMKKAAAAASGRSGRMSQMQQMMHGTLQFSTDRSMQTRVGNVYQIRQAIGLDREEYYGGGMMTGMSQQPKWNPSDYGEARLASIAWLMKFSQSGQNPDEFYQTRKKQAEESTDQRVQTDWYYLISLRHESHAQYQFLQKAAKKPEATLADKMAYLNLLQSRSENPKYEINEETGDNEIKLDPLDDDELEFIRSVYREASQTKGNEQIYQWGGDPVLGTLMRELRLAGKTEEADKLFSEKLAAATKAEEIAMIMPEVLQKGDFEKAISLLDRLAELKSETSQANPNPNVFNYMQYVTSPQYQAEILGQLMWNRAKKDKLDDVLALWKRYVSIAANREKPKLPANRSNQQSYQFQQQIYVNIYSTKQNGQRGDQIDFPTANAIYEQHSIQSLRQTYVLYKEADRAAELIAAFAAELKNQKLSPDERQFWHFGLGYLHWWNDDKDEALAVLSEAMKPLTENLAMRFELARLHERRNEREQALEIIDSLTPTDQTEMQQREVMALRLAVNTGNVERARLAAERLFGLRLDSNLQMALARQMHQLGMHEQAEAVLARTGRQAGNRTDVMTGLMEQYASTGKNDVAVQIAHQLLRRSASQSGASGSPNRSGNESGARQQALAVLNRSGKLPEMIKKVEGQLEKSPKSQRLMETLLEYYSAAGNDKKVQEINEKLSQFKIDDPQFRYQLGMKLLQAGKTKEAAEHFKVVLAKDQRIFMNRYWEIQNAYENQNKLEEYADLIESVDLKSFRQNPWYLSNAIQNMSYREKSRDRAVALFKKAWEALPDNRSELLSAMHNDYFWKIPEIYDYARQGIIPTETSVQRNPWAGFGQTISWSGNGKMDTLIAKMLTMAQGSGKLDALATEVEETIKKLPKWEGGPTFLALINLRRGKIDIAKPVLEGMVKQIEDKKSSFNRFNQYYGGWELAQEMWPHESLVDLAIKLLESAAANPESMTNNEFEYTPGKPLVNLYKQKGRKEDARKVLLKAAAMKRFDNYDPGYQTYQRIRNAMSFATEYRQLGYPADAIKVYQQVMSQPTDFVTAQRYYGRDMKQDVQKGLSEALKELKPESLPELLAPTTVITITMDEKGKPKQKEVVQGVDLLLILESRDLDKTKMSSALVNLMTTLATNPQLLDKSKSAVQEAASKDPTDFALAILNSQVAISSKDPTASKSSVANLLVLVDKTPLEAEPAKGGFTAKQRDAAMKQVPLWLVARDCLAPITKVGNPKATEPNPLRESGEKLAARALEAAKRQSDNAHALAILREWGQLLLTSGDRAAAEAKWAEMLELVIPPPKARAAKDDDKPEKQGAAIDRQNVSTSIAMNIGRVAGSERCDGEEYFGTGPSRCSDPATQPVAPTGRTNKAPGVSPGLIGKRNAAPEGRPMDPFEIDHPVNSDRRIHGFPALESVSQIGVSQRPRLSVAPSGLAGSVGLTPGLRPGLYSSAPLGLKPQRVSAPRPLTRFELMLAPAIVGQVAPVPFATPVNRSATASQSKLGGVTLAQFDQAAQIAKLAADNGMTSLSLRAITQALHGGPPLEAMQEIDQSNPFGQRQQINENSQAVIKVQQQLASLEQTWRQKGVTDDVVFALLMGTVLPESRPIEVFLYPQPLSSSPQQPQSVSAQLVKAAVKANKTEALKQALDARLKQPLGELSSRILLAQLAMAERDIKTAREQLTFLSDRLKQDSLRFTSELACHAAVPAMTHDDLRDSAVSVLMRAVDQLHKSIQTGQGRGQIEPTKSLTFVLARHYFKTKRNDEGRKLLEAWIGLQTPLWSNYGGDYPSYQRKLALLSVAGEFGRAGMQADSLDMFGRFADAVTSRDYSVTSTGGDGMAILNGLAAMKPADRYTLLKTWAMPTKDRQSVRFAASLLPGDKSPPAFDSLLDGTSRPFKQTQYVSTADLLVASAAATGKLAELQQELEPLAAKNIENAKFLLLLTRIANSDDAKIAADLQTELGAQQKADADAAKNNTNSRRQPIDLTNAILVQAAIAREATRAVGQSFATHQFTRWSKNQDHINMAAMRRLYNAAAVGEARATEIETKLHDPGLAHWSNGAFASGSYVASGALPSWWLSHEGMLQHVCGPDQSYLFFNYPLTGTFEFSFDVWLGGWAEGNAGYSGIIFDALNLGAATRIYPIGMRDDSLNLPEPPERRDRFNRVTIRVTPDSISHFVNGTLTHKEDVSGESTSPWLSLQCDRVWQTVYRDLRLTGTPVIPREVKLSGGSSLFGWTSRFYNETTQPRFSHRNTVPQDQIVYIDTGAIQQPIEFDWTSIDGVIRGRRTVVTSLGRAAVAQSRLQYLRPLRSGETLRYEFWYEPGDAPVHVHPAMDRLAMLLEPDGVKLHWMTETSQDDSTSIGLSVENVLEDKAGRQGTGPLPLKAKDWNRVALTLTGDVLTVSLNDQPVYERTLEPENDRQFGFYHDRNATEARVRNVVLSGDWPKTLAPEVLANLIAPTKQPTAEERRRMTWAFEEKFAAASIDSVIERTRALEPTARYAALADWVLPNDDHVALRLYSEFTPADAVMKSALSPLAPVLRGEGTGVRGSSVSGQSTDNTTSTAEKPPHPNPLPAGAGRGDKATNPRERTGGELLSPAVELVSLAASLGKLDELEKQVQAVNDWMPLITRQKKAMLGLVAMAKNDTATASAQIKAITPARPATLDDNMPIYQRWPEVLLVWEATRIPALRGDARTLADLIVDSNNRKNMGGEWEGIVRRSRNLLIEYAAGAESFPRGATTSPKGQWSQVTFATAADRANGLIPVWRFAGTTATHLPGYGQDPLYFNVPLRGRFTIESEVTTFGWRELRPMYNVTWAAPNYTLEQVDQGSLFTNFNAGKITPKLDSLGDWYVSKIQVEPGKISYFANGRKYHELTLPAQPDPWFALHSWGHYGGAVRSVRITGQPEVPAEINVTAQEGFTGWWHNMYPGESVSSNLPAVNDTATWKRSGDEITASRIDAQKGRAKESLLVYHRPMLEDGEFTYDFFHAPGQTMVHPALGRTAFLIETDGVKLHWLTDGAEERTGLSPDNVTVVKTSQRGNSVPLKPNDWNSLRLTLKGDTVTLALNGSSIYEHTVEPGNSHQFALFRYSGETDVRVKNVIYRGNWLKSLPSLKEQELNPGSFTLANFKEGELKTLLDWDCTKPKPDTIEPFGAAGKTTFKQTPQGLVIT